MFHIRLSKEQAKQLPNGVQVRINCEPQTLFRENEFLAWVDSDSEIHIKRIADEVDDGDSIGFICSEVDQPAAIKIFRY